MKKSVLVLAMIAASCSIAAANEVRQDRKATVLTVAAAQMTDAEMDAVTAGTAGYQEKCNAHGCHWVGGGGQSWHRNANNGYEHSHGHRGARFLP
jgi:hypothetical protein